MRKKSNGNFVNGSTMNINRGPWVNRVCIGVPMTGLVRAEWVHSRYGQVIPTNWSHVEICQYYNSYIPIKYQVSDAENLIAKHVVEGEFQWLFMIEHDNILPPECFLKMNQYMIEEKIPIVAGLYFTKSVPPEPLIFMDQGWGYYDKWKLGDKVWCKGVPFGCTLIHGSIIRALWAESPEYIVDNGIQKQMTRRVFQVPSNEFSDPSMGVYMMETGTSDLAWCKRLVEDHIFEKAGWPQYQKMERPLLVDTTIFCKHITNDGIMYPLKVPAKFLPYNAVHSVSKEGVHTIKIKAPVDIPARKARARV